MLSRSRRGGKIVSRGDFEFWKLQSCILVFWWKSGEVHIRDVR